GPVFRRTIELYDVATGVGTDVRVQAQIPNGPIVLLPDGRLLFLDVGYAQLFDERTGTWHMTGPLREARSDVSPSVLTDGGVLVAGGRRALVAGYRFALTSAEVFDPARNIWSLTGSVNGTNWPSG